jgi:hypothetical protein
LSRASHADFGARACLADYNRYTAAARIDLSRWRDARRSQAPVVSPAWVASLDQQRDPFLVERSETQALVKTPCIGVPAMTARIDACNAQHAQMIDERRQHRAADSTALPLPIDRHVIELGDKSAA